jgi:hypothetical protein
LLSPPHPSIGGFLLSICVDILGKKKRFRQEKNTKKRKEKRNEYEKYDDLLLYYLLGHLKGNRASSPVYGFSRCGLEWTRLNFSCSIYFRPKPNILNLHRTNDLDLGARQQCDNAR